MKKSRFTESEIVGILKEADAGLPVGDVIRRHGISTTGGVTINAAPFLVGTTGTTANWSAGDSFVIYNNSGSNQNITAGASVTFRLAGTATTGTPRVVAQYGVATCLCVTGGATPTFVISGSGVS